MAKGQDLSLEPEVRIGGRLGLRRGGSDEEVEEGAEHGGAAWQRPGSRLPDSMLSAPVPRLLMWIAGDQTELL